jgi:hypothetical protein
MPEVVRRKACGLLPAILHPAVIIVVVISNMSRSK